MIAISAQLSEHRRRSMQSDPLTGKPYSSGYDVVTVNKKSNLCSAVYSNPTGCPNSYPTNGKEWGSTFVGPFSFKVGHSRDISICYKCKSK